MFLYQTTASAPGLQLAEDFFLSACTVTKTTGGEVRLQEKLVFFLYIVYKHFVYDAKHFSQYRDSIKPAMGLDLPIQNNTNPRPACI